MREVLEAVAILQTALREVGLAKPLRIIVDAQDVKSFIGHLQRAGWQGNYPAAKVTAALVDGYYNVIFNGVVFALDFTEFELLNAAPQGLVPQPVDEMRPI